MARQKYVVERVVGSWLDKCCGTGKRFNNLGHFAAALNQVAAHYQQPELLTYHNNDTITEYQAMIMSALMGLSPEQHEEFTQELRGHDKILSDGFETGVTLDALAETIEPIVAATSRIQHGGRTSGPPSRR